ncbi:hypothetical protein JFY47_04035 [Enterobacter asburiae]|uniref:hypothetical protein n=1 Tax=Enterobacter asburiae TaxID=61645 RepID=UPI0018E9D357|nr:hypothetical protein [Enterobacter asburiae]MBJ3779700.1 hypothetical protein [Enterobacter asburiae]
MQYKRMSDEFIILDVEKINGYLCAIESLNGADYPKVDYSFTHLKNTGSLLKSIEGHIAATYPNTVLDYWHIKIENINKSQFRESIKTWFFRFGRAEVLRDQLKPLQDGFLALLNQLVYTPQIYRVNMIPPVWYATCWELILLDSDNGLFMLEFNFDE